MNLIGADFLRQEEQNLSPARTWGDALKRVAQRLWRADSAKSAEREWGIDRISGKNVARGVAGGNVLLKALLHRQAEYGDAWELLDAVGLQLLGETRDQYDERKLANIIERSRNAEQVVEARRERRRQLVARARSAGDDWDRLAS